MAYPASINSIPERTDGPDQIIYAAHANVIRTALLDLVTALGNAPQGNKASVEARLDVNINDDGFIDNLGQIRIVGKSGCKYSTIQSAINSISDMSASKPYVVFVLPGMYTETITTKNYVTITGISSVFDARSTSFPSPDVIITAPSGQSALLLNGGSVANLAVYSTQNADAIIAQSQNNHLSNIYIKKSGTGYHISRTSGYIQAFGCRIFSIGSIPIALVGATHFFDLCNITSYEGGQPWVLSSSAKLYLSRCSVDSDETSPNIASGCTLFARLCQFSTAPSGDGTFNAGTMSGSNCDTWYTGEM